MVKVAVSGASGRMGQMILKEVFANKAVELVAALDRAGSPRVGEDAGAPLGVTSGIVVTDSAAQIAKSGAQVLIDFTRPEATLEYLKTCFECGCAVVIGTTGFSAQAKAEIVAATQKIPVIIAPNMSSGMNVTFDLVAATAKLLPDYDCEIVEMHHNLKIDAPSGTAIEMGHRIAEARGQKLEDVAVFGRHGRTRRRETGTIGFAALRGGDVVGDHTVIFAGPGERIEITHRSSSRQGYAGGAVRAAEFICGKAPGLYSMADVLGL